MLGVLTLPSYPMTSKLAERAQEIFRKIRSGEGCTGSGEGCIGLADARIAREPGRL